MLCEKSASTNAVDFCRKRSSPGIWALEIAQSDAEIFRSEGMPSRMDKLPPPNRPGLHDKLRALSEGQEFKSHSSAVLNMLCEKSASTNAVDFCRKRSSPGIWALEIAQRDAEIFRRKGMPSRMDKSPSLNRPGLHDKSRAFSEGHNFKIEATCDG